MNRKLNTEGIDIIPTMTYKASTNYWEIRHNIRQDVEHNVSGLYVPIKDAIRNQINSMRQSEDTSTMSMLLDTVTIFHIIKSTMYNYLNLPLNAE